jgi:hypothetical protein
MFAGTKVKTIGAPTMWDFTNVLGSKLAYNSDNHESSGSNRTLHTQHGKVLDCAKQHFKLFSTHGKTTLLLHNKKGQFCFRKYWPLTKNKVFRDKTLCAVAKIYWRLEEPESPPPNLLRKRAQQSRSARMPFPHARHQVLMAVAMKMRQQVPPEGGTFLADYTA